MLSYIWLGNSEKYVLYVFLNDVFWTEEQNTIFAFYYTMFTKIFILFFDKYFFNFFFFFPFLLIYTDTVHLWLTKTTMKIHVSYTTTWIPFSKLGTRVGTMALSFHTMALVLVSKIKIANAVPQNVVCNYQLCHYILDCNYR